jgi:hypothetical protein
MLCERCVLGGKCESFVPDGQCAMERQAYDDLVSELMDQYGLEGLVDEISVSRAAMYLIRAVRAEVYEANVGVSDLAVAWGRYIAGLDNMLRGLLKDLALSRSERKKAEKGDVLVDVDKLLSGIEKKGGTEAGAAKVRKLRVYRLVMKDWSNERRLRSHVRGALPCPEIARSIVLGCSFSLLVRDFQKYKYQRLDETGVCDYDRQIFVQDSISEP